MPARPPADLPATPADALVISSRTLRFKIAAAVRAAELFGFWRRPSATAATALEEMIPEDIYYWVYKSRHPIVRSDGARLDARLTVGSHALGLPPGFEARSRLTLGACGDLFRSRGLEDSKDRLFAGIADLLFDQDLSYANFESPITEQPLQDEVIGDAGPPIECCSLEQFETLKGHEGRTFTVLHTANNHMADMGLEGLDTTQRVLAEAGIFDVGTNRRPEAHGKGRLLERGGLKIGFASATFGLNGHVLPEGECHRINVARLCPKAGPPELDLLLRQIDDCKARGCDFIAASLHWGYEFEFFPRRHQVETAHALVEHGADAVLGHHPHVVQPVELYRPRRDPARVAVIAYSLGSLTWGFTAPHLALGAVLNLTLSKGCLGGQDRTFIETAAVTPVVRSYGDGPTRARIDRLADHLEGRIQALPARDIAAIERYAELVLGG